MDTCANCETTEHVRRYSFDLDLPSVLLCGICVMAISVGDLDMVAAMKRGRVKIKPGDSGS